jgi:hypothetical protein
MLFYFCSVHFSLLNIRIHKNLLKTLLWGSWLQKSFGTKGAVVVFGMTKVLVLILTVHLSAHQGVFFRQAQLSHLLIGQTEEEGEGGEAGMGGQQLLMSNTRCVHKQTAKCKYLS